MSPIVQLSTAIWFFPAFRGACTLKWQLCLALSPCLYPEIQQQSNGLNMSTSTAYANDIRQLLVLMYKKDWYLFEDFRLPWNGQCTPNSMLKAVNYKTWQRKVPHLSTWPDGWVITMRTTHFVGSRSDGSPFLPHDSLLKRCSLQWWKGLSHPYHGVKPYHWILLHVEDKIEAFAFVSLLFI